MENLVGHFSDGETAARQPVTLRLTGEVLEIVAGKGPLLGVWHLETLRLVDDYRTDRPMRLTGAEAPDARLTVAGETLRRLRLAAPHLGSRKGSRGAAAAQFLGWALALVVLVGALFLVVPRIAAIAAGLVPVRWEVALGDTVVERLATFFAGREKDFFCESEAGMAALDRLGERLNAVVDSPYRFRVRVVDGPMVNAFAAPGGQVVILRGLIEFAEGPQEVAAVLAHELGHVVERHVIEAMIRYLGLQVILEAMFGDPAAFLPDAAGVGALLLELSYDRAAETAADAMAVDMLEAAGIRSDGLATFFRRLEEEGPDLPKFLEFLSTHPPMEERARKAEETPLSGDPGMPPEDWVALREICG